MITIEACSKKYRKIPAQLLNNKALNIDYSNLIRSLKISSSRVNVKLVGRCIEHVIKEGIDEKAINTINHIIYSIKTSNAPQENVSNSINVIYSTLIKRITAEDVVSGRISPETLRNLVYSSVQEYIKNPLNEGIDYRHILGRYISLKKICEEIYQKYPKTYVQNPNIAWTDVDQLNLLSAHEKIRFNLEESKKNFSFHDNYKSFNKFKYQDYSQETVDYRYKCDILNLLKLTFVKIKELMQFPMKNKDVIEDKLEIAYTYFDKVSFGDELMPDLMKFFNKLRVEEKKLAARIKAKLTGSSH